MLQVVNGRAFWSWVVVTATTAAINWVSGWPVNEGVLLLALMAVPSAVYLLSDRFAAGRGERARAIQEVYERSALRRDLDFYQNPNVRETLDDAGQHAYDLVDDAIQRRDHADEGAV